MLYLNGCFCSPSGSLIGCVPPGGGPGKTGLVNRGQMVRCWELSPCSSSPSPRGGSRGPEAAGPSGCPSSYWHCDLLSSCTEDEKRTGEEGQEKKTLHPSSFISTKWKHCGVERAVNSPPVAVLKSDHLDHKTVWIQMKFGIMSWTASNSWRLWNKIMLTEMWRGELWNYTDIINGIIQKLSEPKHHFYLYLHFWEVFLCFKSLKMFCCFCFLNLQDVELS